MAHELRTQQSRELQEPGDSAQLAQSLQTDGRAEGASGKARLGRGQLAIVLVKLDQVGGHVLRQLAGNLGSVGRNDRYRLFLAR